MEKPWVAKAVEEGRPSPLDNRPELWPDLKGAWDAFHRLSSSRAVGMGGVGGIPFGAIDRYAQRYPVDDFEEFHALLLAMDAAFIEHVGETTDA